MTPAAVCRAEAAGFWPMPVIGQPPVIAAPSAPGGAVEQAASAAAAKRDVRTARRAGGASAGRRLGSGVDMGAFFGG
jgi:hypothetical protein